MSLFLFVSRYNLQDKDNFETARNSTDVQLHKFDSNVSFKLNWLRTNLPPNDGETLMSSTYFKTWEKPTKIYCDGRLIGYSNEVFRFHNVLVDKSYSHADALGVKVTDVAVNQTEESEVYKLSPGFFRIPCEKDKVDHKFDKHSAHLQVWIKAVDYTNTIDIEPLSKQPGMSVEINNFTVAMMRYEFTNVYWVMMDMYNIFLTMSFFKKSLSETNVIIIDKRPQNHLDSLYETVFHAKQLHNYPNLTLFKDLVWMFPRYKGPILKKQPSIPLASEFRKEVIESFGLSSNHKRNCSALNIHFVWRRNYVAHPRNPSGMVWRKIKNENELLNTTKNEFPFAKVKGVQLDKLTMREQIEYISTTDILVGMHGAAFGFSLLLPPGGGAIEMFPQYVRPNWHMQYLVKWAGVHYTTWKNRNKELEDTKNRYTTVPPDIMTTLIKSVVRSICSL